MTRPRGPRRGRRPTRGAGRGSTVGLGDELVPNAVEGLDELRVLGVITELLADRQDVRVDRPGGDPGLVAPHPLQQLLPGEDPTPVGDEELQEVPLAVGEALRLDGPLDGVLDEIDGHRTELVDPPDPAHPSEARLHPGLELQQGEGLGEVVVRAELEADQLVLLAGARGDEDDGPVEAALPQRLADLVAVHGVLAGGALVQHHVEDGDVGGDLLGEGERIGAGAGAVGLEALLGEVLDQGLEDLVLVFDKQDAGHQRAPGEGGERISRPPRARGADSGGRRGKRSRKVEPLPGREETLTSPPCDRMM